jgi:hypothetical protein
MPNSPNFAPRNSHLADQRIATWQIHPSLTQATLLL